MQTCGILEQAFGVSCRGILITAYIQICCITLLCFAIILFLGFSVLSIIIADLLGNTCLLARVEKVVVCVRFMIGGFVSFFKDRCFVIVLFQAKIDFLLLVTCKIKATSASFLQQKIHTPSGFPLIFLRSLKEFSAKMGKHVTL